MAPHHESGDYDGEAVANVLAFMCASPSALLLTNGTGFIGGVLAPVFFCPAKLMMEESFWWADKGGRDLLRAFCAEAKAMGASHVLLSTLDNNRQDTMHRVVCHMGFVPVERRYMKELV